MSADDVRTYVCHSNAFWAVYDYDNIKLAMDDFRASLRAECDKYMSSRKNVLPLPKYDVVIHYRVGDFLKNGGIICPQSVVRVIKSVGLKSWCTWPFWTVV